MRTFSLLGFASFVTEGLIRTEEVRHAALKKAARLVEKEAKEVIGTYKYDWPPLAASTLAKKGADTPLLETGELRDSISHEVEDHRALIGSTDKVAVYQEFGTSRIPPRSFLGESLKRKTEEVLKAIGRHYHAHLSGAKPTDLIED
jgi:phage gpG-like protein